MLRDSVGRDECPVLTEFAYIPSIHQTQARIQEILFGGVDLGKSMQMCTTHTQKFSGHILYITTGTVPLGRCYGIVVLVVAMVVLVL